MSHSSFINRRKLIASAVFVTIVITSLSLFFQKSISALAAEDRGERATSTPETLIPDIQDPASTSTEPIIQDPSIPDPETSTTTVSTDTELGDHEHPFIPDTQTEPTETLATTTTPVADGKPKLLDRDSVEKILFQKHKEGTSVESYIDTGEESNIDASSNFISDIRIYFLVSTEQAQNRLTLHTGIQDESVNFVRVEGATGYKWENGELVIAYISLPENGSTMVTVTVLPLISERKVKITVAPELEDKSGNVIAKGTAESKYVRAKLLSAIKGMGMSITKESDMESSAAPIPEEVNQNPVSATETSTNTSNDVASSTTLEVVESATSSLDVRSR